jgi:hypothetical protein
VWKARFKFHQTRQRPVHTPTRRVYISSSDTLSLCTPSYPLVAYEVNNRKLTNNERGYGLKLSKNTTTTDTTRNHSHTMYRVCISDRCEATRVKKKRTNRENGRDVISKDVLFFVV